MQIANFTLFLTLLGIFAGPAIAFLSSLYFRRKDNKSSARKTAAQLAQHLDIFAHKCGDTISENQIHNASDGHAGPANYCVPKFSELPVQTDLRLVPPVALSRLLSLQLKSKMANDKVGFLWGLDAPELASTDTTDYLCGLLGMEAVEIAEILRKYGGLPDPEYGQFFYDVRGSLEKQRALALKQLKIERSY